MEGVREYLLTVTCAALLCGILCAMVDEKHNGGALVKLLCGVFMSLTMILPLSRVSLERIDLDRWEIRQEGESAAEAGLEYARQAKMQIIKSQTEAYILDKASLYELNLTVDVTVSPGDIPVPQAVVLRGRVSPYAKRQMQRMLETELGIPKENQQWMESNSS